VVPTYLLLTCFLQLHALSSLVDVLRHADAIRFQLSFLAQPVLLLKLDLLSFETLTHGCHVSFSSLLLLLLALQ